MTKFRAYRKQLMTAGFYLAALGLAYGFQAQVFHPSQPPAGTPGNDRPGASVHADGEGRNAPYRQANKGHGGQSSRTAVTSHRAEPAILANLRPTVATAPIHDPVARYMTIGGKQYPLRTYKPLSIPNDPSAAQWWVTNTHLDQAWDTPPGNHDTLLAVIDTGFALKHQEFANRWYVNPGESGPATSEAPSQLNCTDRGLPLDKSCNLLDDDGNGIVDDESGPATHENPSRLNCTDQHKPLDKSCNLIDDDGDGYADDVSGWDFADDDNSPQAGEVDPSGSGTTHGTETMGVAAATGNNGVGIAGVDWHTKILPLQALDDDSYGDTRSVGRAIQYAAERGANVISISLGSDQPDDYVRQSIQSAIAAGSIVVAAAGNDGCDCMVYPANYPEVLGVGALDTTNQPASFSSWGDNLDILAPGTQITSSTWSPADGTSAYASGLNGTSFATPMVAGILSRLLSLQPSATPLQLRAALTENTNRLSLPAATPRSPQLGYGTLDGAKATSRMTTSLAPSLLYSFSPVSTGNLLNPAVPAEKAGSYAVERCADNSVGSTPLYQLADTDHGFFSISEEEAWQAQQQGYAATPFADVCLEQPQDRPAAVRSLDIWSEFRNLFHPL